jgi:hypothetical protein
MNMQIKTGFLLLFSTLILSCSSEPRVLLFNEEDLDNWTVFVSEPDVAPENLFQVKEGKIYSPGIPDGYIRTTEKFSNFKLHLEWRWPEEPINSGVLMHVQGEDRIWPKCIEAQLKHGNAGDFVLMGPGTGITVRDSTYLIGPDEGWYKVVGKFEVSSEKQPGEWNSYDITSLNGDIEVTVNGVLQNSGTGMTLSEGYILLQSEGSPIEFRNIWLQPL